jgi:hypothetical protein
MIIIITIATMIIVVVLVGTSWCVCFIHGDENYGDGSFGCDYCCSDENEAYLKNGGMSPTIVCCLIRRVRTKK